MGELRNRPAEGLVDGDLLGGVGDVVVAADDVGDLHQRVVDGDDVVVDGDSSRDSARGADEDRVADGFSGELDGAADKIMEAERMILDFEADGEWLAIGNVLGDGGGVEGAASSGVDFGA